jgi:hypothetical protein
MSCLCPVNVRCTRNQGKIDPDVPYMCNGSFKKWLLSCFRRWLQESSILMPGFQSRFQCSDPINTLTKLIQMRRFCPIRSKGRFGAAERRSSSALCVFRFRRHYYPPNFTARARGQKVDKPDMGWMLMT